MLGQLTSLFSLERVLTLLMLLATSFPIHEWAHAWAAYMLGDDTAARQGRLTINPIAHIDPYGVVAMVLFRFGWGKPVPVNPVRLRGNMRASRAIVSVAGPLANLVLATLAAIPLRLGWIRYAPSARFNLAGIALQFIGINLGLMVFNMIPIPPLDGSRVLAWLLPSRWAQALDRLEVMSKGFLFLILWGLSRVGILTLVSGPIYSLATRALFF